MKWLAGISVLLNLALLVAWWRIGTGGVEDVPAPSGGAKAVSKIEITTNVIDLILADATPVPVFQWSMVESESFDEYMANLRRLECPEWLIKEILLAELMRHYEMRKRELAGDRPSVHWLTYREQKRINREHDEAQLNLIEEEHDVMLQLTGSYRNKFGSEVYRAAGSTGFTLLAVHMEPDPARRILSEFIFLNDRNEEFRGVRDGFLTPTDLVGFEARYDATKTSAAALVSFPVFEEFWLRLQLVVGLMESNFELPGVRMNGHQLRELVRIRSVIIDPIEGEVTEQDFPVDEELDEINRLIRDQLASTLGERFAAEYERSQNVDFRDMHEFAKSEKLPEQTVINLFEIQQSALATVRGLDSDQELGEAQKGALRRLIRIETERALESALGSGIFQAYRERSGAWFDRIDGSSTGSEVIQ